VVSAPTLEQIRGDFETLGVAATARDSVYSEQTVLPISPCTLENSQAVPGGAEMTEVQRAIVVFQMFSDCSPGGLVASPWHTGDRDLRHGSLYALAAVQERVIDHVAQPAQPQPWAFRDALTCVLIDAGPIYVWLRVVASRAAELMWGSSDWWWVCGWHVGARCWSPRVIAAVNWAGCRYRSARDGRRMSYGPRLVLGSLTHAIRDAGGSCRRVLRPWWWCGRDFTDVDRWRWRWHVGFDADSAGRPLRLAFVCGGRGVRLLVLASTTCRRDGRGMPVLWSSECYQTA